MIYIHKGDDTDFNDNSFLTFNIITEKDLTGWQAKFILNGLEKTFDDITNKSFELHYSDEETSQFKLGKTTNELKLIDEEGKIKTVAKNIEICITNEIIENEPQLINLPILKDEGIDINISLASNSGGGGGTANHFELLYRDMANQHPISAITDLQETLDSKANKNEIPTLEGYATESFVTNKIAEAELGGGEVDLSGLATKDELNAKQDIITDLEEIRTNATNAIKDVSNLATKEELEAKQATLISGTNIKTINNQSILGEGNITIEGGSGDIDLSNLATQEQIDGEWVMTSTVLAQNASWNNTTGDIIYDLSDILPKDEYCYEGLFFAESKTANKNGNFINLIFKTDLMVSGAMFGQARANSDYAYYCAGSCTLPVGLNRTITSLGINAATANGTYSLTILGYRKLGKLN